MRCRVTPGDVAVLATPPRRHSLYVANAHMTSARKAKTPADNRTRHRVAWPGERRLSGHVRRVGPTRVECGPILPDVGHVFADIDRVSADFDQHLPMSAGARATSGHFGHRIRGPTSTKLGPMSADFVAGISTEIGPMDQSDELGRNRSISDRSESNLCWNRPKFGSSLTHVLVLLPSLGRTPP